MAAPLVAGAAAVVFSLATPEDGGCVLEQAAEEETLTADYQELTGDGGTTTLSGGNTQGDTASPLLIPELWLLYYVCVDVNPGYAGCSATTFDGFTNNLSSFLSPNRRSAINKALFAYVESPPVPAPAAPKSPAGLSGIARVRLITFLRIALGVKDSALSAVEELFNYFPTGVGAGLGAAASSIVGLNAGGEVLYLGGKLHLFCYAGVNLISDVGPSAGIGAIKTSPGCGGPDDYKGDFFSLSTSADLNPIPVGGSVTSSWGADVIATINETASIDWVLFLQQAGKYAADVSKRLTDYLKAQVNQELRPPVLNAVAGMLFFNAVLNTIGVIDTKTTTAYDATASVVVTVPFKPSRSLDFMGAEGRMPTLLDEHAKWSEMAARYSEIKNFQTALKAGLTGCDAVSVALGTLMTPMPVSAAVSWSYYTFLGASLNPAALLQKPTTVMGKVQDAFISQFNIEKRANPLLKWNPAYIVRKFREGTTPVDMGNGVMQSAGRILEATYQRAGQEGFKAAIEFTSFALRFLSGETPTACAPNARDRLIEITAAINDVHIHSTNFRKLHEFLGIVEDR